MLEESIGPPELEHAFRLGGKQYRLSRADVVKRLSRVPPKPAGKYVIHVDGKPYPPKQALAMALNIPLTTFTTMDANRILAGLGFTIVEAAEEPAVTRNESELLLEQYLIANGLDFAYEAAQDGTPRRPDFQLTHQSERILLELKEFRATPDDFHAGFGAYDPYSPIREKINAVRKQFQGLQQHCCALVLYNRDKPLIDLRWQVIYGSMLGNIGFQMPYDPGRRQFDDTKIEQTFGAGGKMLAYHDEQPVRTQNTTISAIIVLQPLRVGKRRFNAMLQRKQQALERELDPEEYGQLLQQAQGTPHDIGLSHLRVIVHENPYAATPFPRDLFTGPWDERYGASPNGHIVRLFAGTGVQQLEQEERPHLQQLQLEILRYFKQRGATEWHDITLPDLSKAVTCNNHKEVTLVLRRLQENLRAIDLRKWTNTSEGWQTRPFGGDLDVGAFFWNENNTDGNPFFQVRLTHHSLAYLT